MSEYPYTILIANGPNLGRLGIRQPEIYGRQGLDALPRLISERLAAGVNPDLPAFDLEFFQSNHEGELIDRLEAANDHGAAGVVLNAGAFAHTSLALADCLAGLRLPCVEVHITNILARPEAIRQQSLLAPHCIGLAAGFGLNSYALGVQALLWHLQEQPDAEASA